MPTQKKQDKKVVKPTTKKTPVKKVTTNTKVIKQKVQDNPIISNNIASAGKQENNLKSVLMVIAVILVAIILGILLFSQKQSVPGVSHLNGTITQVQTKTQKIKSTDTITVNILNKQSPFFGKKIEAGLEGKLPNGQTIKIVKIEGDTATIETNNPHELAGKTLIFDIEIKSNETDTKGIVKDGDKIKVDYTGKLQDGTVFDSSIEKFAKMAKNYVPNSGRNYEPLEFTVGAGQMIKGFDAGVIGMKVGEKKKLTIVPKDAYGEATMEQKIPSKYLNDNIEQDIPAESFMDSISKTFPIEALGDKGKNLQIGQIIEENGISGKVTAISGSGVTLEIENSMNPFAGKEIVVGATADYQGNTITIEKITSIK